MAEWLGFNGPPKGAGSVEDVVSHLPPVKTALRTQASFLAARTRSYLQLHRDTGNARVAMVRPPTTKLDWHVAIYDITEQDGVPDRTDNNNKSAISIEMGHWVKTKNGRVWVDGINALGNAVDDRVKKYGKST